jgi:hypothetical protein
MWAIGRNVRPFDLCLVSEIQTHKTMRHVFEFFLKIRISENQKFKHTRQCDTRSALRKSGTERPSRVRREAGWQRRSSEILQFLSL